MHGQLSMSASENLSRWSGLAFAIVPGVSTRNMVLVLELC